MLISRGVGLQIVLPLDVARIAAPPHFQSLYYAKLAASSSYHTDM